MATPNDIVKLAISQLGYKESPSGSNKTKYGKEYGLFITSQENEFTTITVKMKIIKQ